ncbi:transcriptional regulator, PAS domain linked with LysR-type HTH domain [Desulfosarcina variabilis str. Montpellier]|uniref:PocR ligand-binding domain-containing protein n=1 Tax=Desulfosarcina variabilis TaxID=2300 RepID=UPI003AFA65BF
MPLELNKIIDLKRLTRLFEAFYSATGIAVSIVSLNGKICADVGYQKICTDFYLRHSQSASVCLKNQARLRAKLMDGQNPIVHRCPFGLFNGATPMIIDHTHVASLFTGQFLLEPPDAEAMAGFKQQAAKWDFNEAAFTRAAKDIPIFSEDRVKAFLHYLKQLSEMIGEMGHTRLKLEAGKQDLRVNETRYRQLFESANDGIFVLKDGILIDCNQKALDLFHASREEMIGESPIAHSPEIQPDGRSSMDEIQKREELARQGKRQCFDWHFVRKDGTSFDADISLTQFMIGDMFHILAIVRDVTERKKMIQALQEREKELDEKSRYLEKVNQALKASLDHREIEKRAVEENMLVNLKRFVFPYIEALGNCKINTDASAYLNIIETNLKDVVSRFSKTVFWKYQDLTPTEVQVADLIRSGKDTKAIAQMLGLSPSSVQWHRKNIREKFGLTNKKINLQTYLASLSG